MVLASWSLWDGVPLVYWVSRGWFDFVLGLFMVGFCFGPLSELFTIGFICVVELTLVSVWLFVWAVILAYTLWGLVVGWIGCLRWFDCCLLNIWAYWLYVGVCFGRGEMGIWGCFL